MTEIELKKIHYQNRIDYLSKKNEIMNHALIQKAKRKLRALDK